MFFTSIDNPLTLDPERELNQAFQSMCSGGSPYNYSNKVLVSILPMVKTEKLHYVEGGNYLEADRMKGIQISIQNAIRLRSATDQTSKQISTILVQKDTAKDFLEDTIQKWEAELMNAETEILTKKEQLKIQQENELKQFDSSSKRESIVFRPSSCLLNLKAKEMSLVRNEEYKTAYELKQRENEIERREYECQKQKEDKRNQINRATLRAKQNGQMEALNQWATGKILTLKKQREAEVSAAQKRLQNIESDLKRAQQKGRNQYQRCCIRPRTSARSRNIRPTFETAV